MNLKFRIVIIITVILLTNFIVATFFMIQNVREILTTEMQLNTKLAINVLAGASPSSQQSFVADLNARLVMAINSVRNTRYTYAWFESMEGQLLIGSRVRYNRLNTNESFVPHWFVELVEPKSITFKKLISQGDTDHGYFYIKIDTSDEVIELWHYINSLFWLGHVFLILIVSLVYIVLYQGLNPLKRLNYALGRLEEGDFSVRVKNVAVPELAPIYIRFNHMVAVLEKIVAENHALTEKMLTVQENERRDLARELHDELGPCLFGIQVDLVDINKVAKAHHLKEVTTKVSSIKSITTHIQALVRKILSQLRPINLDDLGLHDSLQNMLIDWQNRQPEIDWQWNLMGDYCDIADTVQVTVYRIIQECITNSVRHANASHIKVDLRREAKDLHVVVADDGKGMKSDTVYGFGLIGMRERVSALGGQITFDTEEGHGLQVQVFVPLKGNDV